MNHLKLKLHPDVEVEIGLMVMEHLYVMSSKLDLVFLPGKPWPKYHLAVYWMWSNGVFRVEEREGG